MMMTPKQRRSIIVAFIVAILILLFLLWFFLFRGDKATVEPIPEPVAPPAQVQDTTPSATTIVPVTAEAANARTVAMNFAERFGTYSTDAPFVNVKEVKELSTPEFYAELLNSVSDTASDTFRGVNARALSVTLESGNEDLGPAQYAVSVQNEVQSGTRANATIEYKSAVVIVEKRGSSWLVNSFQWK